MRVQIPEGRLIGHNFVYLFLYNCALCCPFRADWMQIKPHVGTQDAREVWS